MRNYAAAILLSLPLFVSLLPGISHAAAFDDIGALIFRDVLRVPDYPGAPFSGRIVDDLVMFFFIPTVFIIIIIYSITGRMFANAKVRLMLGIALYLFIVVGGYFRMFMLMAGPYFVFIIFIIGLLLYFLSHFGIRLGGGGGGGATAPGTMLGGSMSSIINDEKRMILKMKALEDQYEAAEQRIKELQDAVRKNPAESVAYQKVIGDQQMYINSLQKELYDVKIQTDELKLGGNVSGELARLRHKFKMANWR